jgi:response regulator RpfG family c-di-GMP phosphodiesterase
MKDWEMIDELRSSILYRSIPLMVISSLDKNETKTRCEEFGIAEYYMKPFNPVTLSESINMMTGKTWGTPSTSLS